MLTKNQLNRIKNLRRLLFWSAWKRVFLFITEPGHDKLFERFKKINKNIYLTKPEPWLTFTAIDFIKERLQEGLKILEWSFQFSIGGWFCFFRFYFKCRCLYYIKTAT